MGEKEAVVNNLVDRHRLYGFGKSDFVAHLGTFRIAEPSLFLGCP